MFLQILKTVLINYEKKTAQYQYSNERYLESLTLLDKHFRKTKIPEIHMLNQYGCILYQLVCPVIMIIIF